MNIKLPHSKSSCTLTAQELKHYIKSITAILSNKQYTSFEGTHGYLFLTRKSNQYLFSLLDCSGFFDFHCSNKRRCICSLHQIVLFAKVGFKLFLQGHTCPSGICEIHHLDHNPKNCSVNNLVYVTPQENQLLASITRMSYYSNAKLPYIGAFLSDTQKHKLTHFAKLCKLTFERTYSRLGFHTPDISLASWLLSLPSDLGKSLYKYWLHVPSFASSFYTQIYGY
jgi:hypothetical protein